MAFLETISGSGFGEKYQLDHEETVLGRHPDCDVTIDVGAVSRQHARIHKTTDGNYELEDLKSRNGTYLNGTAITGRQKLKDRDLIRICDIEFTFRNETPTFRGLLSSGATSISSEGSSFNVMLVDDQRDQDSHSISSKLDIRSSQYGSQLTTTPEMRLRAMMEITQNLGRAVKLEEVLPKVLDTLFKIFLQADRAFIVLSENGDLVPRWIKTRKEEQEDSFRISRTIMREVMETKEAIISVDASNDERFEMSNSIADFKIRSIIVAPLLDSDENAIGAMQIDTLDSKRRFESTDLELLACIATQAGVAIENAQLHEQAVHQQRVEQDLELARNVQQAFLPGNNPGTSGYEFFSYYHPADQIGGDYYDYIELADGRLAIIVADVVGHGVAAAMLMAKLSAETRFLLASKNSPSQAITKLNHHIATLGVEKFVTLLCLVLDPESGKLDIVNAGHMCPIWLKTDGTIEEPGDEITGVPIGILEDFEYEQTSISIGTGERLVLYTDGINEAPNAAGDMFGIKKLQEKVAVQQGELQEIGDQLISEVRSFIEGTPQADDMCLVIIGRQ